MTSASACSLVFRDYVAALGGAKASPGGMLSRAQALEDLDVLIRTLEHVHPDRFRSRDAVDAERRRLTEAMPASLTATDLCLRLSALVATIDDSHTTVSCHRLILRDWEQAANASPPQTQQVRMFPPYMRLDDQQHLIVGWPNDAPGLAPGDRLLRVNGQDVDALLVAWTREVSHDTDFGRRAWVARSFRLQLALHGINAPYRVAVAAPGSQSRDVIVAGEPVNYLFQERPTPAPAPAPVVTPAVATTPAAASAPPAQNPSAGVKPIEFQTAFFNYRLIGPPIAYMNFFSISDGMSTQRRFRKAVDAMFERVASDRPHVLIIDIRENGGGDDAAASALLRHITEKPFRLLGSLQIKRSEEARAFGKSIIRPPFRWLGLLYLSSEGRQYYTGKIGSLAPPLERPVQTFTRVEPFFEGPVCVLTGPHTGSAAVGFADAVKTYRLATIVGEETGDQPNTFGNPMPFPLPHSGLTLQVATARALRANGDASDFSSVKPDIVLRPTAADIRAGVDPVLERAKSCPERSIR